MSHLYTITIKNWSNHNPEAKRSYKKTLISNAIIHDAKVNSLPVSGRWLFISLLLLCGEQASSTVTLTEQQVNSLLGPGQQAARSMDHLQRLQLVTFEKTPLRNRTELKEEKRTEEKEDLVGLQTALIPIDPPQPKKPKPDPADAEANRRIKAAFIDAYRIRYGVEPVTQNATFNTQVANLRKKLGVEDAVAVVKFYLTHHDSFYLKKTHSFGMCLSDADTLRTQMLRGKPITQNEVRRFEAAQKTASIIDEAKKGGF